MFWNDGMPVLMKGDEVRVHEKEFLTPSNL